MENAEITSQGGLTELLNKSIFGDKMTVKQLLLIIIVVIAVLLVLKLMKGIIKFIIVGVTVCVCLVRFGIIAPAQLTDISKQIIANGIEMYQEYAGASDNIRIVTMDKKKGTKGIEIKVMDNWINIYDIDSIVNGKNKLTLNINGNQYTVNDPETIEMLKSFTDGNFIQRIFKTFQ